MSSDSYSSYSKRSEPLRGFTSDSETTRRKAYEAFSERIHEARETMGDKKEAPKRDTGDLYDKKMVKLTITAPKPGVDHIHVVLIDNSGSNRVIANHMKESSAYLTSQLQMIDPLSQIAFMYFSDHCDGDGIIQEVDFISPNTEGDKILHSTLRHVHDVNGGDAAEAIECALWKICEINFGTAKDKHLYLITDVVAHGMGMASDDGCPEQRDWRTSLKKVRKTFTSFELIGCGSDVETTELQRQFIEPDRIGFDHIDLSAIREEYHRRAITTNALLFLIARHTGIQGIEMFLAALYAKWLEEPIFGLDSDLRAQEAVNRFAKYIEAPEKDIKAMLKRVLVS